MIHKMQKRLKLIIILALALTTAAFGAREFNRSSSMKKPLVYLVPEQYIGPTFVFFGQKDGVDVFPDPLGNAVNVPRNGVIKLRGSVDDLITEQAGKSRNVFWVSVAKNGTRKVMIVNNNTERSDNGESIDSYLDEDGKLHEYRADGKGDPFFYFSSKNKNERMIFAHGGCKHQKFGPDKAQETELPDCAKFLVVAPSEFFKMPHWLWDDTTREYKSIQDLESEANERAIKIEHFYK